MNAKTQTSLALFALILLICGWHASYIIHARDALRAKDPTFLRITNTSGYNAECGGFVSGANAKEYPDGEAYYVHGQTVRTARESISMRDRGEVFPTGRYACDRRFGGAEVLFLDPLLLPLFGRANSLRLN